VIFSDLFNYCHRFLTVLKYWKERWLATRRRAGFLGWTTRCTFGINRCGTAAGIGEWWSVYLDGWVLIYVYIHLWVLVSFISKPDPVSLFSAFLHHIFHIYRWLRDSNTTEVTSLTSQLKWHLSLHNWSDISHFTTEVTSVTSVEQLVLLSDI